MLVITISHVINYNPPSEENRVLPFLKSNIYLNINYQLPFL